MIMPRACVVPLLLGLTVAVAVHAEGPGEGAADDRAGVLANFESIAPSPEFSPARVVAVQLAALRRNDAEDRGIAVAFRFASPANKRSTGPLPRFASMIRNGPYRLMLEYRRAIFDPVSVEDGRARQRVVLLGTRQTMSYVFYLSRQTDGPCRDCWMTDAVTAQRVDGKMV